MFRFPLPLWIHSCTHSTVKSRCRHYAVFRSGGLDTLDNQGYHSYCHLLYTLMINGPELFFYSQAPTDVMYNHDLSRAHTLCIFEFNATHNNHNPFHMKTKYLCAVFKCSQAIYMILMPHYVLPPGCLLQCGWGETRVLPRCSVDGHGAPS